MPTITTTKKINNLLFEVIDQFDIVFATGVESLTAFTSTQLVFASADGVTVTFDGTGFAPTPAGVTGNIDDVTFDYPNGEQISITGFGLSVSDLLAAYSLEDQGLDVGAVEGLFLALDWDITSNKKADNLDFNAQSSDGVALNFAGDDTVRLNGGDDRFWTGDGNDTAFGGNGSDVILGGDGRDNIRGGNGDDFLYGNEKVDIIRGGKGEDFVSGNDGNDRLFGGDGNDGIAGGTGNDKMNGGAGADFFQFSTDAGDDVIEDYNVAEDTILLGGTVIGFGENDPTLSQRLDGILVTHEHGTILLKGLMLGIDESFNDYNIMLALPDEESTSGESPA